MAITCLSTPESAAKIPVYSMGNRDKNATATGACPALNTESKISSTASTGRERSADAKGANNFSNEGTRYAMIAKIKAKTKEIAKASNARRKLARSAIQKAPLPRSAPISAKHANSEGTRSSFPAARYRHAQTTIKNPIAANVCHAVFASIFLMVQNTSSRSFQKASPSPYR